MCMFIYVCLSFVCLFVCMCLSVCLSVPMCVCLSVCMCVYVYILQCFVPFQSTLDHAQFGLDLPSAEKCLQDHHSQHETIVVFQDEVEKVTKDKVLFERGRENILKICC